MKKEIILISLAVLAAGCIDGDTVEISDGDTVATEGRIRHGVSCHVQAP